MDPNTTPQGNRPAFDQKKIDKLNHQISNCRQVINCTIDRLNISIIGQNGEETINARFFYHGENVPPEFKVFLQSYADRLLAETVNEMLGRTLVRLGNHVVDLEDLINEYTSTETPSIDADTVAAMRVLPYGESMTILINSTPHQLQKLS